MSAKIEMGTQPAEVEEWVRNYLEKPDAFKSSGLDGMYSRVLRKLAEVISEPIASLRTCRGQVRSKILAEGQV